MIPQSNFNCRETPTDIPSSKNELALCDLTIGLLNNINLSKWIFIVILCICILLNIYPFIHYFLYNRESKMNKKATLHKMFLIVILTDILTCIYWLISFIEFTNGKQIQSNYKMCYAFASIYIIIFTFQFTFVNCLLYHFKLIKTNPILGILKPLKIISIYVLISFIISLFEFFICSILKVIGKSPLSTCFIQINSVSTKDKLKEYMILIIPFILFIGIVFQFCRALLTKLFTYEPKFFRTYIKCSLYIGITVLLHLAMFISIIATINTSSHIENIIQNNLYKKLLSFSLCITVLIPLIMSLIRIIAKITSLIEFNKKICSCIKKVFSDDESTLLPLSLSLYDSVKEENLTLKKFISDIFVGLSYSFKKSKTDFEYENYSYKDIESIFIHEISNTEYKTKIESNDEFVNSLSNGKITIIEYAPTIFAKLRSIDHINHDEMYKSFLPKNNSNLIENASSFTGTNSTFVISTSDNKFILKTISEHEYVTATYKLLPTYIEHIEANKKSLLCPIYGIFKMIMLNGKDECLILVMRNMIGPFSKDVITKFDLKGTTRNRISDISDYENIEKNILKDTEFNEAEKIILLPSQKCEQVRDIIKKDVTMLRDLDLMDYSLFLIKIRMNKNELYEINKEHERRDSKTEDEYSRDSTHVFDTKNGNKIEGCFRRFLYPSLREGTVYVIVITKYIHEYNLNKKDEGISKIVFSSNKKVTTNADPKNYSERFIEYIEKITNVKDLIKFKLSHTSVIMEESNEISIDKDISHS